MSVILDLPVHLGVSTFLAVSVFAPSTFSTSAATAAVAIWRSCSPVPPPMPTAPMTCPSTTTGTPPRRLVIFPPLAAAASCRLRFSSGSATALPAESGPLFWRKVAAEVALVMAV